MPNIVDRFRNAWNGFRGKEEQFYAPIPTDLGPSSSYRLDRTRFRIGNERSIISSIYTRIGIDSASIPIIHARLDENKRYIDTINSSLNNCFSLEANIDQTGRSFIQDIVMSMCDEGCVAIVPTDTDIDPAFGSSYNILTLRTGKIIEWYPEHVKVDIYNQIKGRRQEIILSKRYVAVVENPLYSVMNEPNSTLQRLISKLNLLDVIDNQSGSGKLDLIIQLPYVIKTPARQQQAEARRTDIETQLRDSKYGIAYTDGTEKITQLNRPAENNLMGQIEYLTNMLFSQLGLTPEIFNGTADEKTMLNYYNRTINPILSSISDSMTRVFLTKTARSQGQAIIHIRDPFSYVPTSELPAITDSFTRNEVLTTNEIRGVIGYKPSKQKGADELKNKNIKPSTNQNNGAESSTENQNERTLDEQTS